MKTLFSEIRGAVVVTLALAVVCCGLYPHISVRNAQLQAARVAKAGGLSEQSVRDLINRYTDKPQWGFLGEPGVNVLRLNLALDGLPTK